MTEKTVQSVKDLFFRVKQFYYGSAERTETALAVSAGEVSEYVSDLKKTAVACLNEEGEKTAPDAPRLLSRVLTLIAEALLDRNYRLAGDLADMGIRLVGVYRFPYLGRARFVKKVLAPLREKHGISILAEEEAEFLSLPSVPLLLRPSFRTAREEGHYVNEDTDEGLRAAHPLLYFLFVFLGALVFFGAVAGYLAVTSLVLSLSGGFVLLGILGSALLGVGLFSLLMTFVRQYMGHRLTLFFFICGAALIGLSWLIL